MTRVSIALSLLLASALSLAEEPVPLGSRRELFVDDALVERLAGRAELRLQQPTPREVALETGEPWEGNATNYVTVFQDGDKYRMYYRGSHFSYLGGKDRPSTRDVYCYAESSDGMLARKRRADALDGNGRVGVCRLDHWQIQCDCDHSDSHASHQIVEHGRNSLRRGCELNSTGSRVCSLVKAD